MTTPDPPPRGIAEVLDQTVQGPGIVQVEAEGRDGSPARIEVEVEELGPLGVRIKRLRVEGETDASLGARARALAENLRPDGERLVPIEVDETLGSGVLRTARDEVRDGYFEARLDPAGGTELGRVTVDPESGERSAAPFTVTRRQLGRLAEGIHASNRADDD